jgi:hypothetical protein
MRKRLVIAMLLGALSALAVANEGDVFTTGKEDNGWTWQVMTPAERFAYVQAYHTALNHVVAYEKSGDAKCGMPCDAFPWGFRVPEILKMLGMFYNDQDNRQIPLSWAFEILYAMDKLPTAKEAVPIILSYRKQAAALAAAAAKGGQSK